MSTSHREPEEFSEPTNEQLHGVHITLEGGEEDTTERPSTIASLSKRGPAASVTGEPKSSEHLNRARQYHAAIHRVLLREWDPIGVAGAPQAQDEYDTYVAGVYKLLIHREPRDQVFDYLWRAETEQMGLRGSRPRTEQVVEQLLQLRQELEGAT